MKANPIDLMFGGMEKLSPGSNEHTLHVLRLLPERRFDVIVDAGCGTGRQTIALSRELQRPMHAIDSYEPFLEDLRRRARDAEIGHLVMTHCMDMNDIPRVFPSIDLLWSEGAAYNIGFSNALAAWATVVNHEAFVVVSELSWLREKIPNDVREFFVAAYPDLRSIADNIRIAEEAGFTSLSTYTIPGSAWVEGYYDILEPRGKALVEHPDADVRDLAVATLREIDIFNRSDDSYGYVFYILRKD